MSYIDDVKRAVEHTANSTAEHLESVPVIETFRGQTVWEGMVEVFSITNPPPARAYGWAVDAGGEPEYVAVLGKPPIDNPLAAVRAWIVSQAPK